jgi:gliding motility-associated-like protein
MKSALIKKLSYIIVSVFTLMLFVVQQGLAQSHLNTPYPIIFVHGLNSDYTTWGSEDGQFDNIIDYLDGAGLQSGGNINLALKYTRMSTTLNVPKEQEVHLLNQPSFGDYYTINFNVHANGFVPVTHVSGPLVIQPVVTDLLGISNTATQFGVSLPDEFTINDIIRVRSEFMKVTAINGNRLTILRGACNSDPVYHIPNPLDNLVVWNLSNESNQASIAKQGYALKLAIDAVKLKTGAKKVILVGHSMGGLAAREYIKNYSNSDVAKIVTIGTPHYGSNISDFPNGILALKAIDGRSDAVRDLRTTINDNLGIYLFGGNESSISGYDSQDENANGLVADNIDGLNSPKGYASLQNIARTWITSVWHNIKDVGPTLILGKNDGIVLTKSQYISSDDTLSTTGFHTDEPKDYYTLLRGLDEPGTPSLAYEVGENSATKGFITFGQGNSIQEEDPSDVDLYKIIIKNHSSLKIDISGSQHSGIILVNLLNSDQGAFRTIMAINQSITEDLEAGTYFIQVNGQATHGPNPSYQYPYTLTTTTTVIPPSKFTASPAASLPYYDVIVGQFRDKTVTLTNSGTTAISVFDLSLINENADQFSITDSTTFSIAAGQSKNVTIRFSPTSIGAKTAALKITSNSTDSPIRNITLNGLGVAHATKTLTVTNDVSYNYGDLTIITNKSKVFTLQNTGSDPMTVTGLAVIGQNANDYTITNPPAVPFNLQSGDTKQITVSFFPLTVGVKSANFVITNNSDNDGTAHPITLFGNGTNSIYSGITGSITAYEYWFDDSYNSKVSAVVNASGLAFLNTNFPTTGLSTGSHFLHIRYKDQKGQWSSIESENFYKAPLAPVGDRKIVTYEYWFDNNYSAKVTTSVIPVKSEIINNNIDVKSLATGTHTYNVKYKDDIGNWSSVVSTVFNKSPIAPAGDRKIMAYEYWFDNNYAAKVTTAVTPMQTSIVNTNIDVKSLATGTHTYNVRYKDDIGNWSSVISAIFNKLPVAPAGNSKIVKYEYWFDNNYSAKVSVQVTPAPTPAINNNINTAFLSAGTHNYNVRFEDNIGQWSTVATSSIQVLSKVANLAKLNLSSGTLTPIFATATMNYSASVSNATASITVIPTVSDTTARVKVNGTAVTSGTASKAIPLNVGSNVITAVVTAQDGITTKSYTMTITRLLSANALLTSIKLIPTSTLTTTTGPGFRNYTTTVANNVASVAVAATAQDATAKIRVNGITIPQGSASLPIALKTGSNVITTVVTAQDGTTTNSYIITITRTPLASALLTSIKLTPNSILTTTTGPGFRNYTTTVANSVASVAITATSQDAAAKIRVNGVAVPSGTASVPIALSAGSNVITTIVTAQDGLSTNSYIITITRVPLANALLTSIKLTPGSILTTTTGPGFRNYTTSVANSVASITVTATAQDAGSTIKMNGVAELSGIASLPIMLKTGSNIITTGVTSKDGTIINNYIITVTRAMSALNNYYQPLGVNRADSVRLADGIIVHQAVSPNGDGFDDFLVVDGITSYPDNSLSIMNRNGVLIFKASGYDNSSHVFDGHSYKTGKMQQAGTYFYSLDYKTGNINKHKTGFIILKY